MDCKDRPAFPVKKLIQARLPFKRLNLVSKEKTDDGLDDMGGAQGAPVQGHVPGLETSLDHLEDSCHMGSDIDFRPKLVNGKGPLDNFLRSQVKTSIGQTVVIIDLTEDSSDPPDGTMGHDKLNSAASPSQENVNGVTDEAGDDRGLPMDILAARPRAKSPPATPPGQAVPSESETLESSPEEDSVLSHSSLSSSSPTSSPEGQSAPAKQHSSPSPLPASTPVRRVSIYPESVPSEFRGFWVRPLPLHPGTPCPPDG
ncbi:chromatin assembly factor 1 subunit A-like [Pontoporia blainvillei]|uniref:Chromatin assembly factor 1 subunit A-like n=1 Tax=Pontoporia blainvillei TaxID=48723 RepID=A0ABX0S7K9_PONBL|nr:chromatin assembly factor 1 subunit A-like [Pontoporia blainvillei]